MQEPGGEPSKFPLGTNVWAWPTANSIFTQPNIAIAFHPGALKDCYDKGAWREDLQIYGIWPVLQEIVFDLCCLTTA